MSGELVLAIFLTAYNFFSLFDYLRKGKSFWAAVCITGGIGGAVWVYRLLGGAA